MISLRFHLIAAVVAAFLLPIDADARTFRVNQVPNGSQFGCALCHNSAAGGGPRNGFGSQVENSLVGEPTSTADVDWAAIYDLDGDSDGYSNGRELGDPDGTWTIGSPNPSGDVYAPYDRNDSPCGDGVLENPPEECDGDELPPDVTCETFGWGPGTLTCASTCRINQEQCEGYEVVIPNSSNPPPNNTNPPNNTPGTNNDVGGGEPDDEEPPAVEEPDDEGGCSTTGSAAGSLWPVLLALVALRRRRGCSANERSGKDPAVQRT